MQKTPNKKLNQINNDTPSRQMIIRMLTELQKYVQDCVTQIFKLSSEQKYEIGFYQQIASRLVNVTVQLQSALGEVNNLIETVHNFKQQKQRQKQRQRLNDVKHSDKLLGNSNKNSKQQVNKSIQVQSAPIKQQTLLKESTLTSTLITPFKLQPPLTQKNQQLPQTIQQQNNSTTNKQEDTINQLSITNDQLYKQYLQVLSRYHHDKHSLNHQNQILLNQWLQTHSNQLSTQNNNNNFYTITKTLIQQLSKYQSVTQYIHNIQSIEHSKVIHQLKQTVIVNDDQQKKWFKNVTKSYLLNMAQLLHTHSQQQQILQVYHQLQCEDVDDDFV